LLYRLRAIDVLPVRAGEDAPATFGLAPHRLSARLALLLRGDCAEAAAKEVVCI
jgi:hypothetical protein